MKFEIREKVQHFKDDRTFNELENLELQPIVKVHQSDNKIEITGHLLLNGEFATVSSEDTDWVEEFDQSDGIHYGDFFEQEHEIETFQYQIPLSIQLQSDRVESIDHLFVVVEAFDYDLLSNEEIELTAYIKLLGVHPDPKQEKPIDGLDEVEEVVYHDSEVYHEIANIDVTNEEQEKFTYQAEDEAAKEAKAEAEVVEIEEKETVQSEEKIETVEEVVSSEEVEEVQTEEEVEEVQSEAVEAVQTEEEVEAKAKIKIGIQGKSRARKDHEETNSNNLLYSLFGNKKVDQVEAELEQVEAQIDVKVTVEQEEVEAIANETEVLDTEIVEEKEYVEDTEATEEATKTIKSQESTKDMLYSLISGNEEKKYTLKMYFVQKEDTIETIAEKYQLKANEIILYNQLQGQEINAGQILYLPNNG